MENNCCKKCKGFIVTQIDGEEINPQFYCREASCPCHSNPTEGSWEEEFKEMFSGYDFTSPSSYAACKEFIRDLFSPKKDV